MSSAIGVILFWDSLDYPDQPLEKGFLVPGAIFVKSMVLVGSIAILTDLTSIHTCIIYNFR